MLELLCLGTLHMVDLCLSPLISPVCPGKPLCTLTRISLTLPFISHIRSKIAIIRELSIDEWYPQPCDLAFVCLTFFCKVRTMAPSPFTLRKEKSQLQTECGQFDNVDPLKCMQGIADCLCSRSRRICWSPLSPAALFPTAAVILLLSGSSHV